MIFILDSIHFKLQTALTHIVRKSYYVYRHKIYIYKSPFWNLSLLFAKWFYNSEFSIIHRVFTCAVLSLCAIHRVSTQTCDDVDTTVCQMFRDKRDICMDPCLSKLCPRTCGTCRMSWFTSLLRMFIQLRVNICRYVPFGTYLQTIRATNACAFLKCFNCIYKV